MLKNKNILCKILGYAALILLIIAISYITPTFSKYIHTSSGSLLSSNITGTIVKNPVVVTGLNVTPKKNVYDIGSGETFEKTDLKVTAMYSDGSAAEVTNFEVSFAPGDDNKNNNFNVFGQKTGVVSYTQVVNGVPYTVEKQFIVYAVTTEELTLEGVPAVEGELRIERYFEQFGVNGVGYKYYTQYLPDGTVVTDENKNQYTAPTKINFTTGTVTYDSKLHAGPATWDGEDTNGQLTVDCTSAPFLDIFGYVGYKDAVPIAFGMYVDRKSVV